MKLLFDENLSPRLVQLLDDLFSASVHVRDVGLKSGTDPLVWEFAKAQGFTITSKDGDFRQRSLLYGAPPKVIALLVGNCPTARVETVLRSNVDLIRRFEDDPGATFLELP